MALEIQYLKEQRVRLSRQKSKEMETYRLRADATKREILRLQKRRRAQEIEYIHLKELHEKQSDVLRRKTEVRVFLLLLIIISPSLIHLFCSFCLFPSPLVTGGFSSEKKTQRIQRSSQV
jgi:hypothetical protein